MILNSYNDHPRDPHRPIAYRPWAQAGQPTTNTPPHPSNNTPLHPPKENQTRSAPKLPQKIAQFAEFVEIESEID
jgi:hypothetical protein